MKLPAWLLNLLPMWDYICPRCRKEVEANSRKCPFCGECFPFPIRVPPRCLKNKNELERYVHEKVFPKLSPQLQEYLAQYFTIIFQDGFESGDFSAWTGTWVSSNCTIAVSTESPHHGTYCAKSVVDGSASSQSACVYKNIGTSYSKVNVRSYAFLDSYGGLDADEIIPVIGLWVSTTATNVARAGFGKDSSGNNRWAVGYYHNGVFYNAFGTNTYSTGNYYCLELEVQVGTSGYVKLYVDGQLEIEVTGINNADRQFSYVHVGTNSTVGTLSAIVYMDCCVVADTYIGLENALIVDEQVNLQGQILKRTEETLSDIVNFGHFTDDFLEQEFLTGEELLKCLSLPFEENLYFGDFNEDFEEQEFITGDELFKTLFVVKLPRLSLMSQVEFLSLSFFLELFKLTSQIKNVLMITRRLTMSTQGTISFSLHTPKPELIWFSDALFKVADILLISLFVMLARSAKKLLTQELETFSLSVLLKIFKIYLASETLYFGHFTEDFDEAFIHGDSLSKIMSIPKFENVVCYSKVSKLLQVLKRTLFSLVETKQDLVKSSKFESVKAIETHYETASFYRRLGEILFSQAHVSILLKFLLFEYLFFSDSINVFVLQVIRKFAKILLGRNIARLVLRKMLIRILR